MLRLLFPYVLLMLIVACYFYFRQRKLGKIVLKIDRALFSRYNLDSLFLIVIIAVASYFLGRFEMQNLDSLGQAPPIPYLGSASYFLFYYALVLVVIAREVEKPALREKGISSPRGFWKWEEVESFRWSKDVLTLQIKRGNRKRAEIWLVNSRSKKALSGLLKKMIPKRGSRTVKKV